MRSHRRTIIMRVKKRIMRRTEHITIMEVVGVGTVGIRDSVGLCSATFTVSPNYLH